MSGQAQDAKSLRDAPLDQALIPRPRSLARCAALTIAVALLVACSGGGEAESDAVEATAEALTPPVTRPAPRDADTVAAAHVLIQFAGVRGAPEGLARTRDEALEIARGIAERARAGEDFAALAREHSDGPTRTRGGDVGVIPKDGGVPPDFYGAILALDFEGISDPVESAFGVHVVRRYEPELASARHILVSYKGSLRANLDIERTREEALARCAEILDELKGGADFAELAKEKSDGPSAGRGGDLGNFARGRMDKTFDEAVFALDVGETSDVVETPFGCHIILRYE